MGTVQDFIDNHFDEFAVSLPPAGVAFRMQQVGPCAWQFRFDAQGLLIGVDRFTVTADRLQDMPEIQ